MDNFESLCQIRRSYRKYTDQPVEQEKLDYILRCALMAPAGKRLNPWEFVVVTDRDVLRQMSACRTYGSQMFDTAQAAIVVALHTDVTDVWMCDGSIAAAHILLAAADQGLGACWCMVHQREDADALIKSLTGVPEDMSVLCVISLGYKGEERQNFNPEKLQYNKIHYGKY